MRDFIKVLIMVLAFILLLVTIITEVDAHFHLSDMGMLLTVMATVTVVPAAAKPVYIWMIAEKEEDAETRAELRQKRTSKVLAVSIVVAVLLAVRAGMNLFL